LDGSGRIRYTEFLAATIEAQGAISEQRLAEAFDRLDSDDSGYISADNLAEILGDDFPREEIDEIFREVGVSKDNQISYAEFLALWEQKHEVDRFEKLQLLQQTHGSSSQGVMTSNISELSLFASTNATSDRDGIGLTLSWDSAEEKEAAMARATFIKDKHNRESKHVVLVDKDIAIASSDMLPQRVLDDRPMDDCSDEGIYL
jgi:EF-hand domain pair